ncbi:baseplate J/gp47 family protein [Brachyspira hyodysenteriae]|uniref:baseplate J/gp47 family protein n=1 Tax=Brachyspira hyodysenteriae TaxID=159 RepID=UPI0022CD4CD7|nr:baseplate J/gp47 family protein [Brachyspira hyodysenteriae]MCZ9850163.1 baseplate J/gp47 family protein [Brachyspira hyodysenteriae]MCZ9878128.1 baseplate J/gp47 family protein [Brachyspira hyodysenteriae]MCZ9894582.1 baseplate J/gp47 family protein [Brachyspira hyodysenteriae]MCZ9898378.1 baseplate J/gp47 family protein [Brachyspira hyodysenteriae]MCZ9951877.1 baseplate J/gp47 family protein [Brachyspira hyodysenteriae]
MQIGNTGVIKDDPTVIRERLLNQAIEKVEGFTDLPSGIQNNLLDESVLDIVEIQDMLANVMNSISPSYANDFIVRELGEAFGLKIKDQALPNTTITFYGLAGVIIPEGLEVGNADGSKKFITTKSDIINATGQVSIYCEGADYYDTPTPANTLNILLNQVLNVTSCTNLNDAVETTPAETISEFRSRFQTRALANRSGTVATLDNALKEIEGTVDRLCTYKASQIVEEGVSKAVLEIIVGGGDDYSVALAIFNSILYPDILVSNPSGDETNRTINVNVAFNSVDFPITYTRPKINQLSINISLTVQSGFINIPSEAFTLLLRPYYENYINNLKIGYAPTGYSFDDLIYQCFRDNSYSRDIITGINYTLTINGEPATLNGERQLETDFDVAYTLLDLKCTLTGASV